jgi:NAD(P)-dependent dehydrogenase (short-subunit alcohol dehydrogenase family)
VDLGLTGKVALVTGATGGIGQVIARTLAAEGARVAIGYHQTKHEAAQLTMQIDQSGGAAIAVAHDLRDPASIRAGVRAIVSRWGSLDILVASAWQSPGWAPPDRLAETTPVPEWQGQLRTNAEGTAYTVQGVLPHMRQRGFGRIVLLSSGAARGAAGMEPYAAAKAAIHGLARSLAHSAGPAGVIVNVVMPGLVPTPDHRKTIPAEVLTHLAGQTPTRRLSTEADVARLVAFLASPANGNTTGAEIPVTGGLHL